MEWSIRRIRASDNAVMATIIREVMTAYAAVGPGYSINDPEVDDMTTAYSDEGCAYYVVEGGATVVGGAGIGPLEKGDSHTCELRKMYLVDAGRGLGNGRKLLEVCLDQARAMGYQQCYLETLARMHEARRLYERFGFHFLDGPLGDTGHTTCDRYMLMEL